MIKKKVKASKKGKVAAKSAARPAKKTAAKSIKRAVKKTTKATPKKVVIAKKVTRPKPVAPKKELNKRFIHHVYFWLTNPESQEERARLLDGLKQLSKVKSIEQFSIGVPADTRRDVVDSSYALSWLAIFKTGKEQAKYQIDPIHLKFVEECSALWSKVIVFDTVKAD